MKERNNFHLQNYAKEVVQVFHFPEEMILRFPGHLPFISSDRVGAN